MSVAIDRRLPREASTIGRLGHPRAKPIPNPSNKPPVSAPERLPPLLTCLALDQSTRPSAPADCTEMTAQPIAANHASACGRREPSVIPSTADRTQNSPTDAQRPKRRPIRPPIEASSTPSPPVSSAHHHHMTIFLRQSSAVYTRRMPTRLAPRLWKAPRDEQRKSAERSQRLGNRREPKGRADRKKAGSDRTNDHQPDARRCLSRVQFTICKDMCRGHGSPLILRPAKDIPRGLPKNTAQISRTGQPRKSTRRPVSKVPFKKGGRIDWSDVRASIHRGCIYPSDSP
jgi:hypothetical protein